MSFLSRLSRRERDRVEKEIQKLVEQMTKDLLQSWITQFERDLEQTLFSSMSELGTPEFNPSPTNYSSKTSLPSGAGLARTLTSLIGAIWGRERTTTVSSAETTRSERVNASFSESKGQSQAQLNAQVSRGARNL